MRYVVSEYSTPRLKPPFQNMVCSYERGLDPWHKDAFKGIPEVEGLIGSGGVRKSGWYALDWCGNIIGFFADGIYDDAL